MGVGILSDSRLSIKCSRSNNNLKNTLISDTDVRYDFF